MDKQEQSKELYDLNGNLLSVDNAEENLFENFELIQRAIDGNDSAFNKLYMQSYRYVFFIVRKYIWDDETAYDAIQETFIKVFRGISKLRSPEAYYGWLTTIAKNTAKNFLRSRRDETNIDDAESQAAFLKEDKFEKEVSLDIKKVLNELEPQDAELLSLVYYDGMRVTQIAKLRGVPAATVYTQLNRAKRNLKSQLAVHGIDKAIYSGNFVAMVATSIRNIIGTSLLSVAIAQQILNNVVNGKDKKEIAVAKVIKQQQKKNVLKIASCIVAISMITSAITVIAIGSLGKHKPQNHNNSSVSNSDIVTSPSQGNDNNSQIIIDDTTSQKDGSHSVVDDNSHNSSPTEEPNQSNTNLDNDENPVSSTVTDSSSDSSNNSSKNEADISSPSDDDNDPPKVATATYIYREAKAQDCYTPGNIPAFPVEDVIVITGVSTPASDGVYTIPDTIDGKRVGAIMPAAFNDPSISTTVKKVIVPTTVKTIWQNAFSECYNLTDIYLQGTTIDILESAFADPPKRTSKLIIHCSRECKTFEFYYYRNIAQNYDAEYQQWNG